MDRLNIFETELSYILNPKNLQKEKGCEKIKKLCEICQSDKYVSKYTKTNQYLCGKHKHHMVRYGEIKTRTRLDRNEIILHENCAELLLYDIKGNVISSSFIDLEDVEKIEKYKWCLFKSKGKKAYVTTTINDTFLLLHRLLMNATEEIKIDHIDRNPLNNRKINLRYCTIHQNNMNLSISKNNTSGVVGVCWHSQVNKWRAYIMLDRQQINLGLFINFDEAVKVRKEAEIKYFGEFAPVN